MKKSKLEHPKFDDPMAWLVLRGEIGNLFSGAPIDEEDLFAGRVEEVRRILEATFEKSRHVVLYGERGVGKTSLSNIFWKRFNKGLQSFIVARIQASPNDSFDTLWRRALQELKDMALDRGKPSYIPIEVPEVEITQSFVRKEFSKVNPNALSVIIIDEYDKISNSKTRELTANLIKELYDFSTTPTVILVGVAENISQLVSDHQSIGRAIVQIPLPRMSSNELREIIYKRAEKTPLSFTGDAIWTIVTLSRGLPYFTQILAKNAALKAIDEQRLTVESSDVEASMDTFIKDTESSFKDAYRDAIRSNQANNLEESLLACALAQTDDEGFFTANDVVEPLNAIMNKKRQISQFDKHLRRFASKDYGEILIQRGGDRRLRYRFSDPMMQPYVIIRGIHAGTIDDSAKKRLLQREQGALNL